MADKVNITVDGKAYADLLALMKGQEKNAPKAVSAAVRRTTRWMKTRVIRAITADLNIKRSDIDGRAHAFGGVSASFSGAGEQTSGLVRVTGKRIPLYRFGPNPSEPGPSKRGVSYKIGKGDGRKRIKDAFIARTASGHTGVFKRFGKKRLPILELFGPSIPHALQNSADYQAAIKTDASDELMKQLDSQVVRFMGRAS